MTFHVERVRRDEENWPWTESGSVGFIVDYDVVDAL